MCYNGLGIGKIRQELIKKNYKNSSGVVKWDYGNIQRILHNKTYCGYIAYNKNYVVDCKSKRRKNNNICEAVYVKAEPNIVPAIISEELYDDCQKQMMKRQERFEPNTANKRTAAKNIYARKMRCKCGHAFRCDVWYKNKAGVTTHGYTCYNVVNRGKESDYAANNITTENLNLCDMPAVSDAKMRMQAIKVFKNLFDKKSLAEKTLLKLQNNQKMKQTDYGARISDKEKKLSELETRQDRYLDLLVDGTISKEQFDRKMKQSEDDIQKVKAEISELTEAKKKVKVPVLDTERIAGELGSLLDFDTDVDDNIIDKYVYRIIVNSATDYVWQLHFKPITTDEPTFVKAMEHTVRLEDAENYAKKHGTHVKKSQWEDIHITVEFAI